MSIDLKPNSLELGRNFAVLNLGLSRKPTNKPPLLKCGTQKVFLIKKHLMLNLQEILNPRLFHLEQLFS
jgi:hypothetical protein